MRKHLQTVGVVVALALASSGSVRAQDKPAAGQKEIVPIKVQVVLSRYQGDKKVSSLPYTLSVNANDQQASSLRMGAQVPVPTMKPPVLEGKEMPMVQSFTYKDVGTNIDCAASTTDDGRFRIMIQIDDSSVIGEEANLQQGLAKGSPSFRSFRVTERLLLKDGQSTQFTTATDKVTGDVVKVDVTINVIK